MSLQHIVLRDFVIVRELDLDLSNGFTALTGETGAGVKVPHAQKFAPSSTARQKC